MGKLSPIAAWPSTGHDDPLHRRAHARTLDRVRSMCLALPKTTEQINHGHIPVIKSGGKNFAIFWRADGRPNICLSVPPGAQQQLIEEDPIRYLVPAYMGVRGWIGVRLDIDVDWTVLESLIEESHAHAAPRPRPSRRTR